jgi:hypothetical protein
MFCYDAFNFDESLAHLPMLFELNPDSLQTLEPTLEIEQRPVCTF